MYFLLSGKIPIQFLIIAYTKPTRQDPSQNPAVGGVLCDDYLVYSYLKAMALKMEFSIGIDSNHLKSWMTTKKIDNALLLM